MQRKRLGSVDTGNGGTKGRSSTHEVTFPSVVAVEQGALQFDGLGNNHARVIEFEGQRYALGETAYTMGRHQVIDMGRGRVGDYPYRVLFAGALAAVFSRSGPLAVVLSLPVSWYTGQREAMRAAMAGDYLVGVGDGTPRAYSIAPDDLHIVPEGFGILASLVCSANGEISNAGLGRQVVGVVDVGTFTTDYLYFDSLELAPARSEGTDKTGLATVWTIIQEEIDRAYGRSLELTEIDHVLHTGYFMDGPERVDVTSIVAHAVDTLAATITGKVRSLWDGGRAVEALVIGGGGGAPIYNYLPFEHRQLVANGHFANCEGGYRFGLLRQFVK